MSRSASAVSGFECISREMCTASIILHKIDVREYFDINSPPSLSLRRLHGRTGDNRSDRASKEKKS